jgi:hypothetical protein
MPEVIEFVNDWFAEVEGSPGRLNQVAFRKATSLRAEIHLLAKGGGRPAEVVNLRFADGTTALDTPLSRIAVRGERSRAA